MHVQRPCGEKRQDEQDTLKKAIVTRVKEACAKMKLERDPKPNHVGLTL